MTVNFYFTVWPIVMNLSMLRHNMSQHSIYSISRTLILFVFITILCFPSSSLFSLSLSLLFLISSCSPCTRSKAEYAWVERVNILLCLINSRVIWWEERKGSRDVQLLKEMIKNIIKSKRRKKESERAREHCVAQV